MSESIRRKSSSRQLLQNLIRVTAQRSQEDAEEVERERRRRAREKQRGEESLSWPEPPQHSDLPHNIELDEELKPSCCLVLEEDEGFSDWSHRLENRSEQEVPDDCRARAQTSSTPQWKPKPGGDKPQEAQEEGCKLQQSYHLQEASTRPAEKMSNINRKEGRTSYSSSVFLPQDVRLPDRTSYLVAGTMKPRGGACRMDGEVKPQEQREEREVQPELQREWRSYQSRRQEEDEEEEELSFMHEEKEDFHVRQEEEDFHVRQEEEDFHVRQEEEYKEEEEEHKMPDEGLAERRISEETNRRSAASVCSSSDGEELLNCYGPMSPTFKKLLVQFYPDEANTRISTDGKCKIIERTESLKKSSCSSMKKTPPPVPVSRINKKLEQYTHALEVSSKENKSGSQLLTDLTSPAEPVSSKKSLFEGGEAWNQNSITVTPSKDADGFKVGVADLINQWVRGSEDVSRCSSPFRPTESPGGKKHKFVVTGHGKYEKVSVNQDSNDDANCQTAGAFYEDL